MPERTQRGHPNDEQKYFQALFYEIQLGLLNSSLKIPQLKLVANNHSVVRFTMDPRIGKRVQHSRHNGQNRNKAPIRNIKEV